MAKRRCKAIVRSGVRCSFHARYKNGLCRTHNRMRKGLPAHIVDSTQIPATNGHSEKKFTLADLRDIVSVGHILENPVRWLITDATQPEWDRIATIRAALAIA